MYEALSVDKAKSLIKERGFLSAIGHESTATILSTLFEEDIPVNRIFAIQEVDQDAIVMKVNGRIEEGRILNKEELEAIGFEFKLLRRLN